MNQRPILIYDGDCRFCRSWVNYWSQLSGTQIHFQPYQQLANYSQRAFPELEYPELDEQQMRQSIQFFDPRGQRYQGAAAAFQVQRYISGKSGWWWLYRQLPGFAPLSEACYRWVASHRSLAFAAQKLLWGEALYPNQYRATSWLFLRLLALVYCCAFVSFYRQAPGLIGSAGLLPLQEFLPLAREQLGANHFWQMPMLFWWQASDLAIRGLCLGGVLASLLLLVNRLAGPSLVFLYLAYLSLLHGGQDFMHYQWDILLLEVGFLAIFLGPGRAPIVWLFRCLLFRFVLLSGAVKLLSGDPGWAALSALQFHFETQPLPTPLAWYAHQLPVWLLQLMTLLVLLAELVLPFLLFLPRRPRHCAAWGLIALQVAILLTGNYNFFNLLTLLLCLFLFDDHSLSLCKNHSLSLFNKYSLSLFNKYSLSLFNKYSLSVFNKPSLRWLPRPSKRPQPAAKPGWQQWIIVGVSVIIFNLGVMHLWLGLNRSSAPAAFYAVARATEPWHWVNSYGLFAVMTTRRAEIIIEGSMDGEHWQAYELAAKPGDPKRPPGWNIPHQPRLDWQLWFAAQEPQHQPPWLRPLLINLLFNSQPIVALFHHNPFAHEPPRYVRARLFDYRFSDWPERRRTGAWWQRQPRGLYAAPIHVQISVTNIPGQGNVQAPDRIDDRAPQ